MDKEVTKNTSLFKGNKLSQALLVSFVFFVIEFILVHFHEPWGDEVRAWAIVNSSSSIKNLLYNLRYEGHPSLWYFLLFILEKITHQIFYMQALHVLIASAAVFIFCFYSPFSLLKNVLFCFGYFFAYEYSIISRNYAIEVLLLFLCAGIYTKHKGKHLLLLSVLFLLLFQTNVYGVIIGLPFYCFIIWSLYKAGTLNYKEFLISALLILVGVIISAHAMLPPANSPFISLRIDLSFYRFAHAISTLFDSYFPLPLPNSHYWSTNILDNIPGHIYIQAILSILILVCVHFLFKENRKVLFFFYISTFGMLLFIDFKYFGYLRHHGHLFLLFVLCYWLYSAENEISNSTSKFSQWVKKYFVGSILFLQVVAAFCANAGDVVYTFSNTQLAAKFLKKNSLDKLPILGDADYATSGIAGILDKDIYFMRPKYSGRFIILDSNWGSFVNFSINDLLDDIDSMSQQKKSDIIVVLSYPFNAERLNNWTLLKSFNNAVIDENYRIYRVAYITPDPIKLNAGGELLISKGYVKEAMKSFTRAISIKKDYGIAYMNLANCYNNGMQDYKKASQYIDSAIKYAPDSANVVFDKGAILFNSGNDKDALGYFKETIKLNPQFYAAYTSVAMCFVKEHKEDEAIEYLNALVKVNPKDLDAYHMLAQCYKDKGDSKQEAFYNKRATGQ